MSSSELEDYWQVLGLEPGASKADVQRAYRKKSLVVHPDRYKGDDPAGATAEFLQLTRAKEVLEDDKARAAFEALQRARAMHKKQQDEQDAGRRKMREDLEAREEAARKRARSGPGSVAAANAMAQQAQQARQEAAARAELQQELERLRRSGRLGGSNGAGSGSGGGGSSAASHPRPASGMPQATGAPTPAAYGAGGAGGAGSRVPQLDACSRSELERREALTLARLRQASERQAQARAQAQSV